MRAAGAGAAQTDGHHAVLVTDEVDVAAVALNVGADLVDHVADAVQDGLFIRAGVVRHTRSPVLAI